MELAKQIEQYYFQHYSQLEQPKQFHFASRLAAWSGNQAARQLLKAQKQYLLPKSDTDTAHHILQLLHKPADSVRIARELREPALHKYPDLYGLQLALFRVRHLKYIYGIDLTETLYKLYPLAKMEVLKRALLNDEAAFRVLSTHAINFCYLVDIILCEQTPDFSIEALYEMGKQYDITRSTELQLLLYFYTHCIIADTNFYIRPVTQYLAIYNRMLTTIDSLIADHYDRISLDNKLEFLVCARICTFTAKTEQRIYNECAASLSNEGTFVIDKLKATVRPSRQSFSKSEHRNVLLIMSSRPFKPDNTVVS